MENKKIIAFDLDGVLVDFQASYKNLLVATSGRNLFTEGVMGYSPISKFAESCGYTSRETRAAWNRINRSEEFWQNLKPLPGVDAVRRASFNENVVFITNRPNSVRLLTERWLTRNITDSPTVILSAHKVLECQRIHADAYMDDTPEYLLESPDSSKPFMTRLYLLDRPYNRNNLNVPTRYVRVSSVEDMLLKEGVLFPN